MRKAERRVRKAFEAEPGRVAQANPLELAKAWNSVTLRDLDPIEQESSVAGWAAAPGRRNRGRSLARDPQCRRSPAPRDRTRRRSAAPMAAEVARGAGMVKRRS